MITTAKIKRYDGHILSVIPDADIARELVKKQAYAVEIRISDGREISADQRKKIFAIIRDVSLWSGHDPEYLRQLLTWDFIADRGIEWFSLSDVDMTTATAFIDYLINFCFTFAVPTKKPLIEQADDVARYLYRCLEHRRCVVCNDPADVHHVDAVGMGRNRDKINHVGLRAIALCRKHHQEAHQSGRAFYEKHHVFGIPLDEYLVKKLNL